MLDCGIFEYASSSAWALRPHIAHKAICGIGTANNYDVFDVHIISDYVYMYINSSIEKYNSNNPDAMSQIRNATSKHAYLYTDRNQQHQGWFLEEGFHDTLVVWTPLDLIRWTYLQFGEWNVSVVTQGDIPVMLDRDLSPQHRVHNINVADDFTGFANHLELGGTVEVD